MFELWLFEQVTAQSALSYFKPVGRDFCQVKMSESVEFEASSDTAPEVLRAHFDVTYGLVQGPSAKEIDEAMKALGDEVANILKDLYGRMKKPMKLAADQFGNLTLTIDGTEKALDLLNKFATLILTILKIYAKVKK